VRGTVILRRSNRSRTSNGKRMDLFVGMAKSDPFFFFSWVLIVIFSICVHEYSHAAAALRLGDDTAARAGHLTLNPLVQMGMTSLAALVFVGVAWGAVPINPYQLSSRQRAWVSFAGPFSNLMLSIVFACLTVVAVLVLPEDLPSRDMIISFFNLGSWANAMLFLFNMLPVPLLDGWSVMAGFFPQMGRVDRTTATNVSFLLIAVFFMSPAGSIIWEGAALLSGLFVDGMFRLTGVA
jgi:Zn-dependent protease